MLKKAIELLIKQRRVDGLREKVETLWVLGSLTDDEYARYMEQIMEIEGE